MPAPANERGWGWPGAPGSTTEAKYRREHLIRVTAGGINLLVRKEVAPLFIRFINELTGPRYNYRLNGRADDWGYANRDVRGRPGVKSNHAWGLAVDLNATTNPMTNDGLCHTDLPPGISKLAAKYGLRWGGDYSGRKDPMHFEFTGTPADAQQYVRYTSSAPAQPSETPKVDAMTPAQEQKFDTKVDTLMREVDMLRRDLREIGEKLGLEIGNRTTLDGKIES